MLRNQATAAVTWLAVASCIGRSPLELPVTVLDPTLDPGQLDPSFGTGGQVVLDLGGDNVPWSWHLLDLTADRRLVVGGVASSPSGGRDVTVLRLNRDGTRDGSFGEDGLVTLDWDDDDHVSALYVDPTDGSIVLCNVTQPSEQIVLARLTADGAPDTTFGTANGFTAATSPHPSPQCNSFVVRPDGSYVGGGQAGGPGQWDVQLVGFDAAGMLDTTFGDQGFARIDHVGGGDDFGVLLQPLADGGVVQASTSWVNGSFDMAVSAHEPDGSVRTSFGTNGWRFFDFGAAGDWSSDLQLAPDGSLALAGGGTRQNGEEDAVIVRLESDGTERPSFGDGGIVTLDWGGTTEGAANVTFVADDALIVVGYTNAHGTDDIFATRLSADGAVDPSFGDGGLVLVDRGGNERPWSLLRDGDHLLYIYGRTDGTSDNDILVVRLGL